MASVETFVAGTYTQPTPAQLANVFSPLPQQIMAGSMTAGNTDLVRTLTNAQVQNAVFIIAKKVWTGQSYTITLPTPSAVPNAKIRIVQMQAAATAGTAIVNCTTNGTTAALFSGSIINAVTPTVTNSAAGTTITFATTSLGGDYVECISNGALWLLTGASSAIAGLTLA